jgi:Zn-dependent M28 family amino/carboxypeptidase
MMEAMRILKQAYPNPSRTIIAGHWSGEEQGLNGSEAWVADHPEVIRGLQALFNQDNGTGRVVRISTQGLTRAGEYFARWMTKMPQDLTSEIQLTVPGTPGRGGTDSSSFICTGAPAFGLSSLSWDYNPYTHHTNVDTYDKIVLDDLRHNATLTAMFVYLASEEPTLMPRDRRELAPAGGRGGRGGRGGGAAPAGPQPQEWPDCSTAQRADPRAGGR